jgi:hypothetical protein
MKRNRWDPRSPDLWEVRFDRHRNTGEQIAFLRFPSSGLLAENGVFHASKALNILILCCGGVARFRVKVSHLIDFTVVYRLETRSISGLEGGDRVWISPIPGCCPFYQAYLSTDNPQDSASDD